MAYNEDLPRWENEGVEPPESKKEEGWEVEEKPPASWFNWLFNRIYESLKELREKAQTKEDAESDLQEAKDYTDDHKERDTDVHGVDEGTVESTVGAQAKADNAETAAKEYTDDHEDRTDNPHDVDHTQVNPEGASDGSSTTQNKHIADIDYRNWENHRSDEENPHNVTAEQTGAVGTDHLDDTDNPHEVDHTQVSAEGASEGTSTTQDKHISDADYSNWEDHRSDEENPHNVTAEQTGAVGTDHLDDTDNPHEVDHGQVEPPAVSEGTSTTRDKHISDADYTNWEDHRAATDNPHGVTKSQVGLGSVDNYSRSHYDSRYLRESNNLSDLDNASSARSNLGLASVASSGSYNDLSNVPSEFPPESHNHSADDITSGELSWDRVPERVYTDYYYGDGETEWKNVALDGTDDPPILVTIGSSTTLTIMPGSHSSPGGGWTFDTSGNITASGSVGVHAWDQTVRINESHGNGVDRSYTLTAFYK